MSRFRLVDKIVTYGILSYIILFTLYAFVARILPVYMWVGETINGYVFILFAAMGVLLIIVDLFSGRYLFKGAYCWVLYLFVVVMAISSIINIKYGYTENAKTIIWTVIQFALYYSAYTRIDREKMMKFLRGMFHLISWIWTAAVLYSLKQFVTMIAYSVEIWPGEWRYQGFSVNRLFGIFNDPNYAGVTSFYVILMLIFLFKNSKNKILKVLCISACVLHAVYIVLSGSRTAAICTVAVSFCVSFFLIRNRCRSDKAVKANLLSCFIAGICAVCVVGAGILLREGLPHIPKIYAEFVLNNQTENSSSVTTGDEENVEQLIAQSVSEADENTFLQRKDVESSTHTRQRIWKNYLQGLRGRYIIGASPRNIDKYMEDAHPDIYDQNEGYETHNGFLSVFAGTGIVGLSVVFIYIVLITRKIGVYCFQYTKIDENFLLILSVIMCILIYTCFFTELFFVNNLTTVIFWTLLGTLMYWLKDDEVNTKVK